MSEENENTEKEQNTKEAQTDTESDDLDVITDDSTYKNDNLHHTQVAVDEMSEEDVRRYETFRRSGFPKAAVKKYINCVIGQAVNPNFVIAISGLAKVFVGEMVEMAKIVQREQEGDGPLLPSHMHEAYRRLYRRFPNTKIFKKAPWE